jgi:hypothetical protein
MNFLNGDSLKTLEKLQRVETKRIKRTGEGM